MKEEINKIILDKQTILTKTVYNGEYAHFEVDTIKTDLDLLEEAAEKVAQVVNDFNKKFSPHKRTHAHIGRTYFSTPEYKNNVLKKLRKKIMMIIKNLDSYEKIGGD
jgi:tetrahydromethanopterin S-methyltransferase subunit B